MVNFVEEGSEAYEAEVMEEYFIVSINGTRIEGGLAVIVFFVGLGVFILLLFIVFVFSTVRRQLLRRGG